VSRLNRSLAASQEDLERADEAAAPTPVDLANDLDKLHGRGSWSTAGRSHRGPSTSSQLSARTKPPRRPCAHRGGSGARRAARSAELDTSSTPSAAASGVSLMCAHPRDMLPSAAAGPAVVVGCCCRKRERELSGEGDELLSYGRAQDNIPINYSTLQEIYPVTIPVPVQTWTNGYWSCGRSKCRPVL
jgi:hypothetical protein